MPMAGYEPRTFKLPNALAFEIQSVVIYLTDNIIGNNICSAVWTAIENKSQVMEMQFNEKYADALLFFAELKKN